MKFLTLFIMLLSLGLHANDKNYKAQNSFVFEGTFIADMEDYTDGTHISLGIEKTDLLIADKDDTAGIILSCANLNLTYSTISGMELEVPFENKADCLDAKSKILKSMNLVNDNNPTKILFSSHMKEFIGVIPAK